MRRAVIFVSALLCFARGQAETCAPSTFVRVGTYPTFTLPVDVVLGEFTSDSSIDAVTVSEWNGTLSVLPGDGNGGFGAPIDSPGAAYGYQYLTAGHFNADSNLDVAVPFNQSIAVFLSNGDGTFQAPAYLDSDYAIALIAADLTGDGQTDLIQGLGTGIAVFAGNGDGTFEEPATYPTFWGTPALTVGDFDGDTLPDLAATTTSNVVLVFLGSGGGALEPPATIKVGSTLGTIVAAELTGDGVLDLALVAEQYVAVLRGNGDGSFRAAVLYPVGYPLGRLLAADLDTDGKTDLVGLRGYAFSSATGVVVELLQQQDGSFVRERDYQAGSDAFGLAAADLDGDGLLDLATASRNTSSVSVLLGEPAAHLLAPLYVPSGGVPRSFGAADFDGDGRIELGVLGTNYEGPFEIVSVIDGNVTVDSLELDSYPQAFAPRDFDGDAVVDLVVVTYYGWLEFRKGNGDGTFADPIQTSIPSNSQWMAAGDFTGDGLLDVAVTDFAGPNGNQEISIYVNQGNGIFSAGTPIPMPHPVGSLVAANFGAGSALDLAATNGACCEPAYDTVFLINGHGDGTFDLPIEYPTGPRPGALAVGDFNNDEAPDLVVTNSSADSFSLLKNVGGVFAAPVIVGIGWTAFGLTTGDFDIDGKQDVAAATDGQNVVVLSGTGDGGFQPPTVYPANPSGAILAVPYGGVGPDLAVGDVSGAVTLLQNMHRSIQTLVARTALLGGSAHFDAMASGFGPLSYQWLKNGVALADGGSISGSQTPELSIDPASFADAAAYSVTVTDACGESTSNAAALYVEFADVPQSSPFHEDIIAIATAGITGGCGGADYCPTSLVRRDQMAAFLLKSEHGAAYTPPPCTGVFSDVPCPGPFTDWIEQLAAEGVTGGCDTGIYCPSQSVTRAQMAIFLLKGSEGSGYAPPAATGIFGDVPVGSFAADFIEDLYNRGISGGCSVSPPLYCPGNVVLRQQMATLLVKTFFP